MDGPRVSTSWTIYVLICIGTQKVFSYITYTVESRISKLLNSKKILLVNKILRWPGSFYTINHMLNSKNLTIVKRIGDKTEFTIARFHCTCFGIKVLLKAMA